MLEQGIKTIETTNIPKEIIPNYSELDFNQPANFIVAAPFLTEKENPSLYFENGEDLEYFAPIRGETSYQLPIGTKLQGKIAPLPTSTISLKIPRIDREIIFGNANKSDLSYRAFGDEKVKVSLEREYKEPNWKINYCGREIGELDKDSVNLFKEKGILREGSFNSVKAITSGDRTTLSTVFQTKSGNNFRIIKQPPDSPKFNAESVDLKLAAEKTIGEVVAVKFEINGKKIKAGEFTSHPTSKDSVRVLQNNRLWGHGVEFEAIATSRNPNYQIEIDRSTLEFPPPERNLPLVCESPQLLRAKIIKESISNPTLYSRDEGRLKITVDRLKEAEAVNYLKSKGIPFEKIEPQPAETKRGYQIIQIEESDLLEVEKQKFEQKFGKPLESKAYADKLSKILAKSPIENEKLFTLPEETIEILSQELTTKSIGKNR
jgi:hypothetical protein